MSQRNGIMSRVLAVVLVFTLCLAMGGCGDKKNSGGHTTDKKSETQAKGRFLEQERKLPKEVTTLLSAVERTDGVVEAFGYSDETGEQYILTTKNAGKKWKARKIKSFPAYSYDGVTIAKDGTIAVAGMFRADSNKVGLRLISKTGRIKEVPLNLPKWRKEENFTNNIAFVGDKIYLVEMNNKIFELDPRNGKLKSFCSDEDGNVRGVFAAGQDVAIVRTDSTVVFADSKTGTIREENKKLQRIFENLDGGNQDNSFPVNFSANEKNETVIVCHKGIFFVKTTGGAVEQILNGDIVSLSDGSMYFKSVIQLDARNYMVFAVDSLGNDKCLYYHYDKNASTVPTKQITVYALEDSHVLQQTISYFQKKNPDVYVKKLIGLSGNNSVTADDAIKALNTDIMAGKGPDVLVTDGLPVERYIEKGILTDMSAEISGTQGEMFENILQAYQKDGKVYQLPLQFYCAVAEGPKDFVKAVGNIQNMAEAADKLKKEKKTTVWPVMASSNLLETLFDADSSTWGTSAEEIKAGVKKYLETAKKLYDMDNDRKENQKYRARLEETLDSVKSDGELYSTGENENVGRISGENLCSIQTLVSLQEVQNIYGIEKKAGGSYGLLGSDHPSFVPYVGLGLMTKGKENDNAKEFIRTAYTAQAQEAMNAAFPVNKKAYEKKIKGLESYYMGMTGEDGSEISYHAAKLSSSQQKQLTQMLEGLTTPTITDRVIRELVMEQGKKYLREKTSLEDAVDEITRKVELYVSE